MRIRRYRLFLVGAVVSIVLLYHLAHRDGWDKSSLEALVGLGSNHAGKLDGDTPTQPLPVPVPDHLPAPEQPADQHRLTPHAALPPVPSLPVGETTSALSIPSSKSRPTPNVETSVTKETWAQEETEQYHEGRVDIKPHPTGRKKAYWQQPEEHYPIPSKNLRLLPSGEPKALPRVQYSFGPEKVAVKKDRVQKQAVIREAFKHAWSGYRNYSLPHDELKPLSKDQGDPFNGWGATLVDSLDTLWIMGLKDEFRDAVEAVSKIDFKTSERKDIPLFETVIRYLGGLVAAYDLSAETVLLNKAVELADILMGAFDTPNRMPAVFYVWAHPQASQPHRGSPRTVLAEIGSLSVEFTRLAQITKEHKYYDAIARITDALEEWQMKTTFSGLWPLRVDASGCKKTESQDVITVQTPAVGYEAGRESAESAALATGEEGLIPMEAAVPDGRRRNNYTKRQMLSSSPPRDAIVQKDGKKFDLGDGRKPGIKSELDEDSEDIYCAPQGLATEASSKTQAYGIASQADSTYEYFPKEYALLGGLNSQYKTMYLDAMVVVRGSLLFRPMTPQNHDILFLAKKEFTPKHKDPDKRSKTIYEGTHLGCYAGGMFALGSKLFDVHSDMAIAERLTNGCVWAYGSTPVGVMPEEFELVPCDSRTSCTWSEARWHEALDPRLEERLVAVETYNLKQQTLYEKTLAASKLTGEKTLDTPIKSDPSIKKRENVFNDDDSDDEPIKTLISQDSAGSLEANSFVPKVPLSHQKYVAAKIQEERLPPGYTKISSRDYRLRPEAIESVFIMYRLTGDESWRDKGWTMFNAIDRATKTEIAHAGIKDVTSILQEQQDTMESFWLAETLKYFYLLFSEPDLISLDDYVL